jgi:uncharacterized membrane protein
MTDLGSDPPQPPPRPAAPQSAPSAGFDFNGPTIVVLLYLSSCLLGVTALVGVVLAYVWKGESRPGWEASHYEYAIRTFWIGLIGSLVGLVLLLAIVGAFIWLGVAVLVVVRCVLSLINAQKREPMPNPQSWLA